MKYIKWFGEIDKNDMVLVGGKNANLGEMYQKLTSLSVIVPNGFATTTEAYGYFIKFNNLENKIREILEKTNIYNVSELQKAGEEIRNLIKQGEFPEDLKNEILQAFSELKKEYGENLTVAVRSSASAEDLPSVSGEEMILVKINNNIYFKKVKEVYEIFNNNSESIHLQVLGMSDFKIDWFDVTAVYKHYLKAEWLFKITTQTGREIIISPDHTLIVFDPNLQNFILIENIKNLDIHKHKIPIISYFEQKNTYNLDTIDVKESLKNIEIYKEDQKIKIKDNNHFKLQKGIPSFIKLTPNFSYFLGIFLSEGSIYKKTISVTNKNSQVIKKVKKTLNELNLNYSQKLNKFSLRIENKVFAEFLKSVCYKDLDSTESKGKGPGSSKKKVPDFIFNNSLENIKQFLKGVFDGDGWVDRNGRIGFASVSKEFTAGIGICLQILGFDFYFDTRIENGKIWYSIQIPTTELNKFLHEIGFSDEKKNSKIKKILKKYKSKSPFTFKYKIELTDSFRNKIFTLLKGKLDKKLHLEYFCKQCNSKIEKTSYYKGQERFYCRECHKAFYEVEKKNVLSFINYDEKGKFLKNGVPWNKGLITKEKNLSYGVFQKLISGYGLENEFRYLINRYFKLDKIAKIEKIEYNDYVYDFVVPGVENFASGYINIITHNSASFAGQQETYLNVSEKDLLEKVKFCFASLFTDRAIFYRQEKGFDHFEVKLSVGVQKMVRSDLTSSGVMFTIDTDTGLNKVIVINGVWGLGELIVQGKVIPDEWIVFKDGLERGFRSIISQRLGEKIKKIVYAEEKGVKEVETTEEEIKKFSLHNDEVLELAKMGLIIEKHYGQAMDIEWAKDGVDGKLYIVQARAETVYSTKKRNVYEEYKLKEKGDVLLKGIAIGSKIASGKVRVIKDVSRINEFQPGEILVTEMTDPDWVPIMKIAKGIIADAGGRTSHCAIVSRELGIPAIVGAQSATEVLKTRDEITIDCTGGITGYVYKGLLDYEIIEHNLEKLPETKTKIYVNIGLPDESWERWYLPIKGVGLAREEFIIAEEIKIHPNALIDYPNFTNESRMDFTNESRVKEYIEEIKRKIEEITAGYNDKKQYFINKLAEGIAKICTAYYPNEVIVRFSDFKTNEYRNLIGGELYEPHEENPMIGWRGASRYYHSKFKGAFELEVLAMKKVREEFGLDNLTVMVPFCRTPEEGKKVFEIIENIMGKRKEKDYKIYVMAEIPSNILQADEFLEIFDGISIGSNDLTQLVLGIDRDNEILQGLADERNESVKKLISQVIRICREKNKYIGICGQAPSDFPEIVEFLVREGIESISINSDVVIKTIELVKRIEDEN